MPFVIAFILETIFESDSAILIVLIVYIPVDFVIWTICCEKAMAAQIKKEISELLPIIDELNLSLDIFK